MGVVPEQGPSSCTYVCPGFGSSFYRTKVQYPFIVFGTSMEAVIDCLIIAQFQTYETM